MKTYKESHKKYYLKNREKIKESRLRKNEEIKGYQKKYYLKNKEKFKDRRKKRKALYEIAAFLKQITS